MCANLESAAVYCIRLSAYTMRFCFFQPTLSVRSLHYSILTSLTSTRWPQPRLLPFVYITTNQFKAQLLPTHLTGELTLVVNLHYDSVGVNFIHLANILCLASNAQEFFHDLERMHRDLCHWEINEYSVCIWLKDTGAVFINQVMEHKFFSCTFKLFFETLKLHEYLSNSVYFSTAGANKVKSLSSV